MNIYVICYLYIYITFIDGYDNMPEANVIRKNKEDGFYDIVLYKLYTSYIFYTYIIQ